jgi:hypothetical protein
MNPKTPRTLDEKLQMKQYEFIWGWSKDYQEEHSFLTWDDIYIYFNEIDKKYYYQVDINIYECGDKETARNELSRLSEINEAFRNFLTEKGIPLDADICFEDLQQEGAYTLNVLYAKFYTTYLGYQEYLDKIN